MAEVAVNFPQTVLPQTDAPQASNNSIVFSGSPRNLATGFAILIAAGLAFTMGMTDVFFARAMAWTFVVWGALLIYNELVPLYQKYEVTDKALIVDTPMRPVERYKVWDWAHIHRLQIHIKRDGSKIEEMVMQVYYTNEGDSVLDREDRQLDPALAQLIIEHAGLKAVNKNLPTDLAKLPGTKGIHTWSKTGK